MQLSLRFLTISLLAIFLMGCQAHNLSWMATGPSFSQKIKSSQLEVFSDKNEVKRPWGALGVIHTDRIDVSKTGIIRKQIDKIRELAAKKGADAVFIKQNFVDKDPKSKFSDPQMMYFHAIAIKYVDKLTKEEKETIENWKPTYNNFNTPD
jgi:hypothetical protein